MNKSKPNRAPQRLSRDEFSKILNLHTNQPWTVHKHEQLFDLLDECENLDEQNLVLDLLNAYENFDEIRATEAFKTIVNHIENVWKLKAENTLIVALHNKDDPGSAQALIQAIKPFFNREWNSSLIVNMSPALEKLRNDMNVIFLDDFIGTGGQFCNAFDWFNEKIEERKISLNAIHLVSLCIMKQAIPRIEERKVCHYAAHYMDKGITGRMDQSRANQARELMKNLEDRLSWKNKQQQERYSLGFMESEALFRYMEYNAPNNNFPIFWWKDAADGNRRHTIQTRF